MEEYVDECIEQARKVLAGEESLSFAELTELLSNAVKRMEAFNDMGAELLKLALSKADYDDEQDMDNLLFALYQIIKYFVHFEIAGEAGKVLELLAEEKFSFTELRYAEGEKTNLRDYIFKVGFYPEILEKMQQLGIDLNEALIKGMTPARIFAGEKNPEQPEKVLDYFSVESMEALDNKGTSAVHCAVRNNCYEMVEAMIRKGVNVNVTEDQPAVAGTTPLHTACAFGYPKIVKLLIDAGADDTLKNARAETPAHVAVTEMQTAPFKKISPEDRAAMIKELKNIDIPGREGRTPLMLAQHSSLFGADVLTPVFIEKGADVNRRDDYGNNALLLHGQSSCYPSIVKAMLDAGLDVNARNKFGDTILHMALEHRQSEAARILIKNGADYNIANGNQVTPMQIAAEQGLEDVLELMV